MSQLSSSLVDASKFVTLIKLVVAANCIDTTPRLRSHLGSNAKKSSRTQLSSKYSSLVSPSQRTRSQSTNNETSSGGKNKQLPAVDGFDLVRVLRMRSIRLQICFFARLSLQQVCTHSHTGNVNDYTHRGNHSVAIWAQAFWCRLAPAQFDRQYSLSPRPCHGRAHA